MDQRFVVVSIYINSDILRRLVKGMGKTRSKLHDGKQDDHRDVDGGEQNVTVVLRIDMHCEECAGKLVKYVERLHGVNSVSAGCDCKELTVCGTMDPLKLRRMLEEKTRKKVILLSLVTKVADSPSDDVESHVETISNQNPAPAPTKTVVLKMALHCNGCMKKIMKKLLTFEGVTAVTAMNLGNDQVTVIGTFDVNCLVTFLSDKLRRRVEVVEETVNPSPESKSSGSAKATRNSTSKGTTAKINKGNSSKGESVDKPTKMNDSDGINCIPEEIPKLEEEEEVVVASLVVTRAKNGSNHRLILREDKKTCTHKSRKEETPEVVPSPVESRGVQAEIQEEARGYNHISYHVDMSYASELFRDDSTSACSIM